MKQKHYRKFKTAKIIAVQGKTWYDEAGGHQPLQTGVNRRDHAL